MSTVAIRLDPSDAGSTIDRRLFGGFVEHLGRHIYDGIHEPAHPMADDEGFRTDVIDLVKELGVTMIRYPGGNFVSGYRWEDGVGPRGQRPRRLDLAWHSIETNQVGLHEFESWLQKVDSELMLAVNLGTRGVEAALDLLEYTNIRGGTTLSDQRIANGRTEPFGVGLWCLGNEMDGYWQLGHSSAEDYGKLASQTAKAMLQVDRDLEFVVCGSSSRTMPTFGAWEHTVLQHTFDDVQFISCHAYYFEADGNAQEFLASAIDMDRFIDSTIAACDLVAAEKKSDKRINISFDEWNIWYQGREQIERTIDNWPVAPRLLEDQYNVLDGVVVGDLLICLLKHSDRVKSASLAQLVNVIAPIMTEPGGPAWRQTTFFPFSLTARLAQGRAVRVPVASPTFVSDRFGEVPAVDAVSTWDETGVSVFLVNRSVTDSTSVSIDLRAIAEAEGRDLTVIESHLLADEDIYAANSLEHPDRVSARPLEGIVVNGGRLDVTLPPVSWAALRLEELSATHD